MSTKVHRDGMSSSLPRLILFVFLLIGLSGCESWIVVEGTVRVPVEVQQLFSDEEPGLLLVSGSVPKTGSLPAYSLGLLCAPQEDALTVSFSWERFGCAKQGTVVAWIERPGETSEMTQSCGLKRELYSGFVHKDQAVASATAVVFEGETGRLGCSSGEDDVQMTLELR